MQDFVKDFLSRHGIEDISHGIAYNISDLSQIKYWDLSKQFEIPFDSKEISNGIFCFKVQKGSVILL